ncbi:MAG: DUF2167 domain-containing protein [Campylobacteraceae bacterium]|jgi:uncharacterized membrane-anchored protein|nr:DUF2167 domain-containing protein [Campylobacteraceae bacterium]
MNLKILAALLLAVTLSAQDSQRDERAAKARFYMDWSLKVAKNREIELNNQAVVALPEGFYFLPASTANYIDNYCGMVSHKNMGGHIVISFHKTGYIKDSGAKDWDADEIFLSLKNSTESYTEQERASVTFKDIEVVGWVEKPIYDSQTHRLIWSASLRNKNPNATPPRLRYSAYLLGREGYVMLDLVTDMDDVEADKAFVKELIENTRFNEGKRYEDFDPLTDDVAEFDLMALIDGVYDRKSEIELFVEKHWVLLLVGFIAVIVILRKFSPSNKSGVR